mgnify:FL=1
MSLQRIPQPDEARHLVRSWQREGLTVGLVPTMGALHEGHLSLIGASVEQCDRTAISIYVNPTQFAPEEDLEDYPRRLDRDCRVAAEHGADLVFCPTDEMMYPEGFCTHVEQEGLTEALEGAFRPTHFRGVLTVVCKLFNILPADRAYFGQKDFQQTVVIRRMAGDLNMPVDVRVRPTVREKDGLALSSRNEYLNPREREEAPCLYRALRRARQLYASGVTDAQAARNAMRGIIAESPLARPDYVEIVDRETLEPVEELTDRAVAVLAVHIGETRLIDNHPLGEELPT